MAFFFQPSGLPDGGMRHEPGARGVGPVATQRNRSLVVFARQPINASWAAGEAARSQ